MRYELINKPCAHCGKVLSTTSRREKVHAACRQAYYLLYHRKNYAQKRIVASASNRSRSLKRYFVEVPCAACGFAELTKKRSFLNEVTRQLEEFNLCPNCIALWRCGMMEAFSWKRIKEAAGDVSGT